MTIFDRVSGFKFGHLVDKLSYTTSWGSIRFHTPSLSWGPRGLFGPKELKFEAMTRVSYIRDHFGHQAHVTFLGFGFNGSIFKNPLTSTSD